MTRLLVSVRSAAEASVALEGGAGLIDVKEPDNGPLGMAPPAVIAEVLRAVSGRVPVSAALGEARDARDFLPGEIAVELAFVKYGAAGCLGEDRAVWESACRLARQRLDELHSRCRVVAAAYADWRAARSPAPDEICAFACDGRAGAFLLDTWGKDGSTLLDWMPLWEVARLCVRCRAAGVPVALAGSLGPREIRALLQLRPDWIAVRGAACLGGRNGTLDLGMVRGLVDLIGVTSTSAG